ncbi:hypothetical protein SD70_14975 [Gordoniibacillus kamchatkensis]|uniref:EF-hand domain-containing protein n=1 Tax=Gordoniibacillus kamchatkensis TaxID=1590651 RepID=A0ABR5AHE4_9BACL|nr:hypothetical protein [Paenibacillus sp. VKM B-2647]KIL40253.1 hypothetical protein SD70_14975 [Paenibacillus sp. VKM B-2647]
MSHWIEINRDSLLTNILVAILFLPIAYLFNFLLDEWRQKRRGFISQEEMKKISNKLSINIDPDFRREKVKVIIKYKDQSDHKSGNEILIVALVALVLFTVFFFRKKEVLLYLD